MTATKKPKTTKGTAVTEKEFNSGKLLLEATNGNVSQVSSLMERSNFTINFIKNSNTFEDYKQAITDYVSNKAVRAAANKPMVDTAQPNDEMLQVMQNINQTMIEIRDCFKWISENVEIKNKRRFL
jgi:hypothetical protein